MRGAFIVLVCLLCSIVRAGASPWETIGRYPDDVDAVVVMENPAERVLLGKTGVSTRGKLAAFGMFTETERAWAALADSFGMTPDEGIRALLSRRVVVLWDRVGDAGGNPLLLLAAADDRWVLSAEVDDAFVRRVRTRLKPVPRRIHQGKPVFAIEQGRFQLVIVEGDGGEPTRMIVSPRAGVELLDRVLDSLVRKNPTKGGSRLGARASEIQRDVEPEWVLAGVVALDRFTDIDEADADQPVLSLVLHTEGDAWRTRIASDIQLDLPEHGAPVALLEAVGGDAVFVMSNASGVVPETSPDSLGFSMRSGDSGGGGSLVVVSRGEVDAGANGLVTTVLSGIDAAADPGAAGVDRLMEALFVDPDTGSRPRYDGRFPDAIRTQARDIEPGSSSEWISDSLQCSWVHRKGAGSGQMVFAIGPRGSGTAGRVRWLSEAADTVDAIPELNKRSTVVSRGVLRPAGVASMIFGDKPGVLSGLLGSIERASWELQRAPFGVRGMGEIRWNATQQDGRLGRQRSTNR